MSEKWESLMKAQVPTHCVIITFHQFQHSLASFAICGLFPHSSPSDSHSFILWPFNMQTRRNMVSDLMGSAFFCCCLFEFVLLPKTNVSGAPFNLACQTASFKGDLEMLYMYNRYKKLEKIKWGGMLKWKTMKTQAELPIISMIFPLLLDEQLYCRIHINWGQGHRAFQNYEL